MKKPNYLRTHGRFNNNPETKYVDTDLVCQLEDCREVMLVVETRWFFGKRCVFSWNHDIVTFQELEPITSDWIA